MGKRCSGCKKTKDADEFYGYAKAKDGLQKYCKLCQREANRRNNIKNRAARNAYARKWNSKNTDKVNAWSLNWQRANPEKSRDIRRRSAHRRRMRLLDVGGSHTDEEWRRVVRILGNRCADCQVSGDHRTLHRDHIIPVSKGGHDSIDNIQPLCKSCNSSKHDRHVDHRWNWLDYPKRSDADGETVTN